MAITVKKVVQKGYTLEVISWENDGNNYRTIYHTVNTLEEAKKLYKVCTELFISENNQKIKGVGNSMDHEGISTIIEFVKNNKELFVDLEVNVEEIDVEDEESDDIEELYDYFQDISWKLMGGSEDYDFRVCESVIVTHSHEDITVEVIEIKMK